MMSRAKRHRDKLQELRQNGPDHACWTTDLVIEAAEGEENKTPKFDMLAYNGGKLQVKGFEYPVVIDLQTADFEGTDQTYINRHHDQTRELGHSVDRRIDSTGVHLAGVFSHDNDDTREIITASQRGKKFKASVEATFPKALFVPRGSTATVNGKRLSGPLYVARNAQITGVAILTRAADMDSDVRIAAEEAKKMTIKVKDELREFIEAAGFSVDDFEDKEDPRFTFLVDMFEQQTLKASKADVNIDDDDQWEKLVRKQREVKAAEDERQRDINRICAQYGDPEIEVGDETVSLAAHGIRSGMSPKEVKLEAKLWDLENRSGNSIAIHAAGKYDQDAEVIECAMSMASGVTEEDIERNHWFNDRVVNEASGARFRSFRVSRLAYQTMQAAGIYHPPGQLDDQYIANTVRAHHKLMASGFTTLSLPGIMSGVCNKAMLAAYTRQASFIPFVFGRASATDFKLMYSYNLEGSGMLEHLPPDGQIKHGRLVESEYTKKLETYAKMLAFTRQDMINDDLGTLSRTAAMLGAMAWKAREYAATQMITTSTIFSTQNGNLLTGNTLSIAGLQASEAAFDAQTDVDGLPISVEGPRILAPSTLKTILMQLQNVTEIRDNSGAGPVFINNPYANQFTGFATPWLDNAVATNNDANRHKTWYRFSDPATTPAFEVIYLNGNDSPVIQSAETDFNTLGMQFRCYYDYGFGESDPRYAQKNVGP